MDKPFLYFDTETTDANIKDLLQLAFITDSDVKLNLYFKPKHQISFSAMAINHITPEMVENKEIFEHTKLPLENIDKEFTGTSLIDYLNFLSNKYIWVAHNANFDKEALERKGINLPNTICTLNLSRNLFSNGDYDLESYSLQYLRYYLGLYKTENKKYSNVHDAFSDVHFLRDLFHYIQKNSKFTVENMLTISKEPQFIRQISFGRYSGKLLEDIARIDRSYLEWIRDNMNDKPDLQWNVSRILSIT